MISVDEALSRITAGLSALSDETVPLAKAYGRVVAQDVYPTRKQPPSDVSAMDGYAARSSDLADLPATLKQIGESAAGHRFNGAVGKRECVRIFTGATVPEGADTVVIQENVTADKERILINEGGTPGDHIRGAGLDFEESQVGIAANTRISERHLALLAAMGVTDVPVRRRPRIAILATGDELVQPGQPIGSDQIVSSNSLALAALISRWGGSPTDLGIARDRIDDLERAIAEARGYDALVTIGGASVGDHDLVQSTLVSQGMDLDFWKIAMRPGKPLMHGYLGDLKVVGLPGNPASSYVCAMIFLRTIVHGFLGQPKNVPPQRMVPLAMDMPKNGVRAHYMRAVLTTNTDGMETVTPLPVQDSSMLSVLAEANCLLVRPVHASPATVGDLVPVIPFDA